MYDDGPFAVQVPCIHGEDSQGSSITIKHIKCSQHQINTDREYRVSKLFDCSTHLTFNSSLRKKKEK